MSDQNPYSAPDAALDSGAQAIYQPKVFSLSGRIGRLRYLAYGLGLNLLLGLVMVPLMGLTAAMGPGSELPVMIAGGFFYIATIALSIMFARRRLNDLNRSGWWFLLFIVPIANLLLAIYLIFFPGTDGENNFGPAPTENSIGVLILGWLIPVFFVAGIAAAVLVPQFAGMPQ